MTMDVREALLHDAEEGRLDRLRQSSDLTEIHDHTNAATLREALRVPAHCRHQPHLIEQGRVQQIRERPHLSSALLGQGSALRKRPA